MLFLWVRLGGDSLLAMYNLYSIYLFIYIYISVYIYIYTPYSMVASQFPCLLDWDGGRHGVDGLDLAVFLQSSQQNVRNLWMFRLIEPQNSDEQRNWRSSSRNESLIYA